MNRAAEPTGSLQVALTHAAQLLQSNPRLAAEQATEILKAAPQHPTALLFLAMARRALDDVEGSIDILRRLAVTQSQVAPVHYELGLSLGAANRLEEAIAAVREAVRLRPQMADAWRTLGDYHTIAGDLEGADAAYAQHIKNSIRDPRLMAAAAALCENHIPTAEALLREHLKQHPTDVAAIRMLAEVGARLRRYGDAEKLLARCLELAPGFTAARHNYAVVLHRQSKAAAALLEVDKLLSADARNPGYANLKAAILGRIGDYEESIEIYRDLLANYSANAKVWMSYGHALKTAGRETQGIEAYRKSIELQPGLGEAYWSLANLKTFRFTPAEVTTMRAQLARTDLPDDDRLHFHFSLGKALEDAGEFASSFGHYEQGNELRRGAIAYDADETSRHVRRCKEVFTREFFERRAGFGSAAPDPIFIVGLPRAGSTLLEQILASHSAVEGTMELPDIIGISRQLAQLDPAFGKGRTQTARYHDVLAGLNEAECRALGEQFLRQTRIQRKTATPFFIDKMPNNFAHLAIIHLALPNAKIIDARRHPLGCCFSGYKQHFARGQNFTYCQEDIGRYYRDYVELMAHFDAVLPGRVHRVFYEAMVEDTEGEVRRLLDHCGLPFEENCLSFHRNERAVRTASSQQVRQPIFRDAVEHWRNYEPWLGPLKRALGPVLDVYPGVPEF